MENIHILVHTVEHLLSGLNTGNLKARETNENIGHRWQSSIVKDLIIECEDVNSITLVKF
jgi:hypothetical protein